MERKREKLGVGQHWGLQRAPRGIRWVSRCPGVPLPEAISSGHHPHRVCPGPASGSQQAVSFPFCPQERTLGFQQRGSSFLKRDSCLRLAATSPLLGLNAQVSYGVLLSLPPLSSARTPLAAHSPPGGHGVSLRAWLAACPPTSRAAGTSFPSDSNEISPLLGALPRLGSAFSLTQLSPVLRLGNYTPHLIADRPDSAHRAGFPEPSPPGSLNRPLWSTGAVGV